MKDQNFQQKEEKQFDQEVLDIARVTRIAAGGRRFSFRALVAVGDRQGKVGLGTGKAKDLAQAVEKATARAQKEMISVPIQEGTIPTEVIGHFKSAQVLLKPAAQGRGLIAGGVVRVLAALAGIENLSSKIISRTNNKINIGRATLDAFLKLHLHEKKLAAAKKDRAPKKEQAEKKKQDESKKKS